MDQQAFRQLLQTPKPSSSSSNSTSDRRNFGAIPKKRAHASSSSGKDEIRPSDLKPSKLVKKEHQGSSTWKSKLSSNYVDRAEARRKGKDEGNEFAEVEKLYQDFKDRSKGVEDKRLLEEQMKFLGGDAKHSVLVKGLDFALLEQKKAMTRSGARQDEDDGLEKAYQERGTRQGGEVGEEVGGERPTRESILEALRRRRLKFSSDAGSSRSQAGPSRKTSDEERRGMEKFRPIGFKPVVGITPKGQREEEGEGEGEEGIKYVNGKRMRKKKKKKEIEDQETSGINHEVKGGERKGEAEGGGAAGGSNSTSESASEYLRGKEDAHSRAVGKGKAHSADSKEEERDATAIASTSTLPKAESEVSFSFKEQVLPAGAGEDEQVQEKGKHVAMEDGGEKKKIEDRGGDEALAPKEELKKQEKKEEEEEEDEDIFAEAGGWDGINVIESEEEEDEGWSSKPIDEGVQTEPTVERQGPVESDHDKTVQKAGEAEAQEKDKEKEARKRDWFSKSLYKDGGDDGEKDSHLPAGLSSIVESVKRSSDSAASANAAASARKERSAGDTEHGDEEEEESKGGRLKGLSDSVLPTDMARLLLERERREAEEFERKKKDWSKGWKGKKKKGGEGQGEDEGSGKDDDGGQASDGDERGEAKGKKERKGSRRYVDMDEDLLF
ncbi:hypothetical protein IE53DRAFT_385660 [Violaceomyces palustris]|uniref:Uncharacterized protein n=1 Tax=Violaceomyces palustris TaxID=1673888 RepID=A0ACD0P1I3_9BASI|nr:hypothetical protein IE53DRAFT_385660 [Violaceomyces palustris]